MSRENPNVSATVTGTLTSLTDPNRKYTIPFVLGLMELWSTATVPDDILVMSEAISAMTGLVVEDDDYEMEYVFKGKTVQKPITVFSAKLVRKS